MKKSLSILLEMFYAEEKDCILPFIAIISNPAGEIELPAEVSNSLSFELVCHCGSATLQMSEGNCILSKHQDICVFSNSGLYHMCFSDDFQGHMMIQTNQFCHSIVEMDRFHVSEYYKRPIAINLTEEQDKQYHLFFEWLKFALRRNPEDAENRIRQLLRASFNLFSDYKSNRDPLDQASSRNDMITSEFFRMLENDTTIGNEDYYCQRIRVSKRSLSRAVKTVTGSSVSEHITNHKVAQATKMISSMSINTPMIVIAERLGFSTLPSFSRFFKMKTGVTPTEFRNSLK